MDIMLLVYLNNPDIARYRIDATFRKSDTIRSFYQRALHIPDYNIEQEAVENIFHKEFLLCLKWQLLATIN